MQWAQQLALLRDALRHAAARRQRVTAAGLLVSRQQRLLIGLQEKHPVCDPACAQIVEHLRQSLEVGPAAHVGDDCRPHHLRAFVPEQLDQRPDHLRRQVVHTEVALILERRHGRRLAGSREAGDDHQVGERGDRGLGLRGVPHIPAGCSRCRRVGSGGRGSAHPASAGLTETAALAEQVMRRMSLVLPVVNLACAVITYVFVVYVVPLPGAAPPSSGRGIDLIGSAVGVAICWIVCHMWGLRVARPMRAWLDRGGDPDEAERLQTVRLPLYEARNTLVVWALAGAVYGPLDVAVGGCAAAGVLISGM